MEVESRERQGGDELAQAFVEELLHTAFSLGGAYVSLLEGLPRDAFPGEDAAAVLIEMFADSCRPSVQAVDEEECRVAMRLIAAVRDRVLEDLRVSAQLAAREG
ncbi:MAG TPA: hypothetical protein VFR04_09025 [Solirubrobacterales bacterium]|nr:hypothetical protein [Solirubrobacterales bacterium]